MNQESDRAERKRNRPVMDEKIEYLPDGIYICLFEKDKPREKVTEEDRTVREKPDAYRKLQEFGNFYYGAYLKVEPGYRGLGYAADLLEKESRFLSSNPKKKVCIAYSEIPQNSPAAKVDVAHGWDRVGAYPPWTIFVPPGVVRPSDDKILEMILEVRPDYAEYL